MDLLIVDLKEADFHTYLHLKQANIPCPHYTIYSSTEIHIAFHIKNFFFKKAERQAVQSE